MDKPGRAFQAGPMSKLRIGILGTGGMGGTHAERFRHNPDVEIAALGDVSSEILARFVTRMKLDELPVRPRLYTDPAAMFREARLDAVAIITPHTLHFEHAMLAAEAGLHVFMEKPMVTSAQQAHALAARFKGTGKIFTIGYNTPCSPEFVFDLVDHQSQPFTRELAARQQRADTFGKPLDVFSRDLASLA